MNRFFSLRLPLLYIEKMIKYEEENCQEYLCFGKMIDV